MRSDLRTAGIRALRYGHRKLLLCSSITTLPIRWTYRWMVCARTDGWCAHEDGEVSKHWLLQEIIPGNVEYSASLLVVQGRVLHVLVMEYTFMSDVYIWPRVKEDRKRRVTHNTLATAYLEKLHALLVGYSGVCNINYKLCDGSMCIFEVNTRVGGDLANDADRSAARLFFEALDRVPPSTC